MITLAYHALYVSVGFPIYTHTHIRIRAAESRGYRGSAVPTIRPIPPPLVMVGARSALLRSADTSNTIAREFRPVTRQLVCPGD